MLAPRHERGAHLVRIRALVVDLRHAAPEATVVAEDALDDVRLYIQVVSQVGCDRTPNVMNAPGPHRLAEALI